MATVTAAQLLSAWELTLGEPQARRGAALVAGCRGARVDEISRWSVAALDAALLDLRVELFGQMADAVTDCPACGEGLEFELNLAQLAQPSPPRLDELRCVVAGHAVTARWPSTDDLVAVCANSTDTDSSIALLERCVEQVLSPTGDRLELGSVLGDLGDGIRDSMSLEMETAERTVELICGECAHEFRAPFDITTFLLSDVDVWANQMLRQIHVLASAHGWSEAEILAMSAQRRRRYLDLVDEDS